MKHINILIILMLQLLNIHCLAQNIIHSTGTKTIVGNGNIQSKEVALSNFNTIDAMSLFNIYLIQADSEKVVIEADENIIELIELAVRHGENVYSGNL